METIDFISYIWFVYFSNIQYTKYTKNYNKVQIAFDGKKKRSIDLYINEVLSHDNKDIFL